MSLHDRIKEARLNAGLTQAAIAEKLGVPASTYGGWEKTRQPTAAQLGMIAEATGATASFLLQDEMKEAVRPPVSPREMQMVKRYRGLDDYGKEAVDDLIDTEYRRCQEAARKAKLFEFDVQELGSAAGSGVPLEDCDTYTVLLRERPPRGTFGVWVNGHSMEPTFSDGDLVVVRHATDVPVGKIGIFTVDGITYIKRRGRDRLISDNDDYDDVYPGEEGAIVQGLVIGRVDPELIVE